MNKDIFAIRGKKVITVSKIGTIEDGLIIINKGKIINIGKYNELKDKLKNISILDYSDKVITPSLIDCHCHLLEYGSGALYPVTKETYLNAGKTLVFKALLSGITAIGEQVCGGPICEVPYDKYIEIAEDSPIRIKFSLNSITIGTHEFPSYSCISSNQVVNKNFIINKDVVSKLAEKNEYPGENIFINATPANLPLHLVPRAGEIVFNEKELNTIVNIYHEKGSKVGAHVCGEKGIEMALNCKIDVLHHAHGITKKQILRARDNKVLIVATPLGGSHLTPNLPHDILNLIKSGVQTSIATDSYLPPAPHLNLKNDKLYGSDILMLLAKPSMELMIENSFNENDCLALLTANPAKVLGLENKIGKLEIGMDADLIIANGVPGLDIIDKKDILAVFIKGNKVISRE